MESLIPCDCGQSFPGHREQCPYCGAAPKVRWVYVDRKLTRLVEFMRGGVQHYHCNGKDYDYKSAVSQGIIPPRRRRGWGFLAWRWLVHTLTKPSGWSDRVAKPSTEPLAPGLVEIWQEQINQW